MSSIRKSVTIMASPGKVFLVLDAPQRIPEYTPGVTKAADVVQTPKRVGDTI